jgi:hypothetical protein
MPRISIAAKLYLTFSILAGLAILGTLLAIEKSREITELNIEFEIPELAAVKRRAHAEASNAACRCCGMRPGTTSMTSNRMSHCESCGCEASQISAAAMMRLC